MSGVPVLEIRDLHKTYGSVTALDHMSLTIEKGSVFGLLGPNGSGKTTTLGIVLDIIRQDSGEFRWFQEKPTHLHRKRIGAILEKPNFYPDLSGLRNLQLICKIKEIEEERISEVLSQVGLTNRQESNFKTYSLGMKQRLAIASALLARPEVLVLDEPTNGLDPQGIAEIRSLITEIAQSGKTIILASHLLDEVEKVCNEFAVLKQGKLIHTGKVNDVGREDVIIELETENLGALAKAITAMSDYKDHRFESDKIVLTLRQGSDPTAVNRYLVDHSIYLSGFRVVQKEIGRSIHGNTE